DQAAALDREDKPVRRLVAPLREIVRPLQRIMRAVDLDRVEMAGGVGQLVLLPQSLRIEAAAPAAIAPAGDADPEPPRPCPFPRPCSAQAHRPLPHRASTAGRVLPPRPGAGDPAQPGGTGLS